MINSNSLFGAEGAKIINQLRQAIIIVDYKSKIIEYVTDNTFKVLGCKNRNELVGKKVDEIGIDFLADGYEKQSLSQKNH